MLRKLTLLGLLLVCGLAGCSQPVDDEPQPITIAQWKKLPLKDKYTPETLERLKIGTPALQTPEGWESFSRTVVASTRQKDFPRSRK